MKIAVGSDLAGYKLKLKLVKYLESEGHEVVDVGNHKEGDSLYAPHAKYVADRVKNKESDLGILICGTGQGMAMAANRVKGIKAAVAYDILPAVLAKEHNDSNVLCTGAWMIGEATLYRMVDAWLMVSYNGHYEKGMKLLEEYRNE